MKLRGRYLRRGILAAMVLVAAAVAIPHMEADRTLRLLDEQGATYFVSEESSLLWMTLDREQTTDDTLKLLRDNPSLIHLRMQHCNITDTGMDHLGTLDHLEGLDLNGTNRLVVGLPDVVRFPALTDLVLADCPWVNDEVVERVSALEHLRYLDLRATAITDAAVEHLAVCKNLAVLNLSDCEGITDSGVRELATLPSLLHVSLAGTSISVECWQQLQREHWPVEVNCPLGTLREFIALREAGVRFSEYRSVSGSEISFSVSISAPVDADALRSLAQIQWQGLDIVNCPVDDQALEWLSGQRSLSSLTLSGTDITDRTVERVIGNPLTYVDLSQTRISDNSLEHLGLVESLANLDLSGTSIAGSGFSRMVGTGLRSLDLRNSTVTDLGIASLVGLPNLNTLNLTDTPVTDAGIAMLGQLRSLEWLNLDGTPICGNGFAGLSESHSLASLTLTRCQLDEDSMRHLAELPVLMYLALGDGIGDRGVELLASSPRLSWLQLPATRLSPRGVETLGAMRRIHEVNLFGEVADETLSAFADQETIETVDLYEAEFSESVAAALKAKRPTMVLRR